MKITRIDVFRANLPLKRPFRLDSLVPIVSVATDTDLEAEGVGLEKEHHGQSGAAWRLFGCTRSRNFTHRHIFYPCA